MKSLILGSLILPMLVACSFLQKQLTPLELLLLPPNQGPKASLEKSKVTLDSGGKQQSFIVINQFSQHDFQVVVLMATGQRVLTMRYDGEQFEQTNETDMTLPGKEIMAVMQFALWPEQVVKKYYKPVADVTVKGHLRQLSRDGYHELEADIQQDKTVVKHYTHHYSVTIQALSEAQP